jgi:hypothetical protein
MALLACSELNHDCYVTRDCPTPKGFIEAGGADNWWDPAGAAGEPEPGSLPPATSGGSASSGSDAAGDGGASGASVNDANGPPRVLGVSPSDGAQGVARDALVVVRFSQPMNAASVEGAYQSNGLAAALVVFGWNEAFTTLTITPASPLAYAASAAATDGSSPAFDAQAYQYGFSAGATDRAGQALPAQSFTFSTLRQVSVELYADGALSGNWTNANTEGIHNCTRAAKAPYVPTVCVGEDSTGALYSGLLSFDLSAFPAGIAAFSKAALSASGRVYGTPESLGGSRLDHVDFAELSAGALGSTPLAALGPFYARPTLADDTTLHLGGDVSSALADDYANRAARANRSQYRLSFAKGVSDGVWDDVEMPTSSVRLTATYLIP